MTLPAPAGAHSRYLTLLGHEVHVTEWGAEHAPPLIAWHGLARTGRDFDDLAAALADRWRVICPDTPGRGLSSWSADPDREYCFAAYATLATALLDALALDRVAWVGTSMGGSLGIHVAGGGLRERITRLVINDIGPTFPAATAERIRTYVGNPPAFATMTELDAYFRTIYAPFGAHTDAQWKRLAETSMRRLPDGRVSPHYDPAIVRQFVAWPDDFALWPAWDAIAAPTLVLHGEASDLLLPEVAREMSRRGPRATIVEVAGCGHAPALNVPEQIAVVRRFLEG